MITKGLKLFGGVGAVGFGMWAMADSFVFSDGAPAVVAGQTATIRAGPRRLRLAGHAAPDFLRSPGRSRKTTSRSACKCSTMPGTSIPGLRCGRFIPSTRQASAPRSPMRSRCARSNQPLCLSRISWRLVESEPAGPRLQADLEIKLSSRVAKWTGVSCIG